MGRASLHFVALGTTPPGPSRREEGAGTAAGKRGRAGDGERAGRAAYGPSADQPYIKKGRPPYDGRPDVQQRKGPTGPDPPARGSLPDLPGTCHIHDYANAFYWNISGNTQYEIVDRKNDK